MALRKGEVLSTSGKTNGCTGLRYADLDIPGVAVGSLTCTVLDVKAQKGQDCACNVLQGMYIPKRISSPEKSDQKMGTSPKIDRALLEPDVKLCLSGGVICVLGQKRYMLTNYTYQGSRNLAQHVRDDFGAGASVAEYSDLCQVSREDLDNFARAIGLGSAFVSFEGCTECAWGGQYFICSHSGVVTDKYILPQDDEECSFRILDKIELENLSLEEDEASDEDWNVDIPAHVARVELCCRAARRLPVLVEISAGHDDSACRVASASFRNTIVSL